VGRGHVAQSDSGDGRAGQTIFFLGT
jgi:hypothetical protein